MKRAQQQHDRSLRAHRALPPLRASPLLEPHARWRREEDSTRRTARRSTSSSGDDDPSDASESDAAQVSRFTADTAGDCSSSLCESGAESCIHRTQTQRGHGIEKVFSAWRRCSIAFEQGFDAWLRCSIASVPTVRLLEGSLLPWQRVRTRRRWLLLQRQAHSRQTCGAISARRAQ